MNVALKTGLLAFGAFIKRDTSPKIVFYHDVGKTYTQMGTDAHLFWQHMALLRSGDEVCFDDGFRGVWDVREVFRARDLHPKIFLAVRLIGLPGYLNWQECRVLKAEYGFAFQCHTWSHQTLVGPMIAESPQEERTESWYHRELVKSRERIADELGPGVTELCFPVGYYSEALVQRCQAAGYDALYTSIPAGPQGGILRWRCLAQNLSPRAFRAVLNGGQAMFQAHYRKLHDWGRKEYV